jgi:hypothetical protein
LPFIVLLGSIVLQCLATYAGYLSRPRGASADADRLTDLDTAHAAALTLLALVIGFAFSMAAGRYDQRKNYEEVEANSIGTEYSRLSLLPSENVQSARALLKLYTQQRILFYTAQDDASLKTIAMQTSVLQGKLWSAVSVPASAQPTPLNALAVAGMNNVIDSEGYTNAAWLYHIPALAWVLMEALAVICNVLFGFKQRGHRTTALLIFPVITVLSFFVIADIDSPRRGVIRVVPQNLILTLRSMN